MDRLHYTIPYIMYYGLCRSTSLGSFFLLEVFQNGRNVVTQKCDVVREDIKAHRQTYSGWLIGLFLSEREPTCCEVCQKK